MPCLLARLGLGCSLFSLMVLGKTCLRSRKLCKSRYSGYLFKIIIMKSGNMCSIILANKLIINYNQRSFYYH